MYKNCIYCKSKNCIKKGKTRTNKRRYFWIVKSCEKTFILEEIKRFYLKEFKKKQWDYILKIIVQGSCKTFKNLNKYVFKMDV